MIQPRLSDVFRALHELNSALWLATAEFERGSMHAGMYFDTAAEKAGAVAVEVGKLAGVRRYSLAVAPLRCAASFKRVDNAEEGPRSTLPCARSGARAPDARARTPACSRRRRGWTGRASTSA